MASQPQLKRILEDSATLCREEARALMQQILAGELNEIQLAALLGALAARGETATELAGFVDVMRSAATPLPLNEAERSGLVDTCGTGGDVSGTFNISTAAALVAAAAGASVAKHGNRAVTSRCGSGDVLEALGIPVGLTPDEAATALRQHRFAFLYAPSLHPAMKAVMPVRHALGVRTVFNVLGPLANPAVLRRRLWESTRRTLFRWWLRRCLCWAHGTRSSSTARPVMRPRSMSSPSAEESACRSARKSRHLCTITPEEFGLTRAPLESLRGGDASDNAAILRSIFAERLGPRREVVLLNTAAVLVTGGTCFRASAPESLSPPTPSTEAQSPVFWRSFAADPETRLRPSFEHHVERRLSSLAEVSKPTAACNVFNLRRPSLGAQP